MGIGDIFNKNKLQQLETENLELKKKVEELSAKFTPELQEIIDISEKAKELSDKIIDFNSDIKNKKQIISDLQLQIKELQDQLVETDYKVLLQTMGIYEPTYDFSVSDEYKEQLSIIREDNKRLCKSGTAVTGSYNVDGRVVQDFQKLILRAFNYECDELIKNVKYNNFDTYKKRIEKSHLTINKLGHRVGVQITEFYKANKIKELTLAFEYAQKKQQEKEEQKELRARMREEAKLQKEIEEARKKLEKEHTHYLNALQKLDLQISSASDSEKDELIAKKQKLLEQIEDTEKAIKDVDYREANKRAGYVYVISNIGAFGENIYKIGMTRRLDPMDRIDELGDASVPFNFDVHAMIFTDDAPKLENALHNAFEDKKVNMVNQRREFFNVSLDEIKRVIKENYDKTVEFVDLPSAEQYRISEKIRKETVNA